MNENLHRANKTRRTFDYAMNHNVLKKTYKPNRLGARMNGPYNINKSILMAQ